MTDNIYLIPSYIRIHSDYVLFSLCILKQEYFGHYCLPILFSISRHVSRGILDITDLFNWGLCYIY